MGCAGFRYKVYRLLILVVGCGGHITFLSCCWRARCSVNRLLILLLWGSWGYVGTRCFTYFCCWVTGGGCKEFVVLNEAI